MKPCSRGGDWEVYPKPATAIVSPGKPGEAHVAVGACIGKGSFNNVYSMPSRHGPAGEILRTTSATKRDNPEPPEDMMQENAIMRVAAMERIHPIIYAQKKKLSAPFRCEGDVSATLMERATPLRDFLLSSEFDYLNSNQAMMTRVFSSLQDAICRTADLGLCLTDLRPENVLCVPQTGECYLIDFGSEYMIWMDERVFEMFETNGSQNPYERNPYETPRRTSAIKARLGASCAKTRAVQLYLMLLLFYTHLRRGKYADVPRAKFLVEKFKGILANSCVPLQALPEPSEQHCEKNYDYYDAKDLMHVLFCRVHHYFRKDLRWFLVDFVHRNGLLSSRCDGKTLDQVVVGGVTYSKDNVSCRSLRQAVLRRLDDRIYPCTNVAQGILPPKQYTIDRGEARLLVRGGKGFGKGGKGKGSLQARFTGEPVEVPDLEMQYASNVLPVCPRD
jgi:hypothetical protein